MSDTSTNLLPEDRQHTLIRGYFMRFGTVSIISLILLIFVAAISLLPTYAFLGRNIHTKEAHLASIESSSADRKVFSAQLSALSNDAAALETLTKTPSASASIRAVLAIPRPGITFSGFEYSYLENKNSTILAISGVAATRDSLRNYQLALQNTSTVASADMPISVYASNANIPFTITMTLSQ